MDVLGLLCAFFFHWRSLDDPLFCILVLIDLVEEVGILIAEDNLGRVNPPGAVLKLHNAEYLTEHTSRFSADKRTCGERF